MSLEDKLLRFVVKGEPDQCWLWTGSAGQAGYGQLSIDGKTVSAHRVAYSVWVGPIVKRDVCHKCDVKLCVNPSHLFNGTHSENMKDAVAKGRISGWVLKKMEEGKKRQEAKARRIAGWQDSMRVHGYAFVDSAGRKRDMMGRMIKGGQVLGASVRDEWGRMMRKGAKPLPPPERNERGYFIKRVAA